MGFPSGDQKTEGRQDGISALVKLQCHSVSGRGILLSKFYRWSQTGQQIIKWKIRLACPSLCFSSVDLGCSFCSCGFRGHEMPTEAVLKGQETKEKMLRAAFDTGGQWKCVELSTGNKAISGGGISMDSFLPNRDIFSGLSGGSRDPIHDHDMLALTASQGPGG